MAYFKDAQEVYEVIDRLFAEPADVPRLVPLTKPVYPRYKAQLEAQGREDLVGVD